MATCEEPGTGDRLASRRQFLVGAATTAAAIVSASQAHPAHAVGCLEGAAPPYPRSDAITGISFEQATLVRQAVGSDIWSCTWAADGEVYAAWGDGGGFEGTDEKGRVSFGVARISGAPPKWHGANVWGGVNPESSQAATQGKGTLIDVEGSLYAYVCEQDEWDRCRLWRSGDRGRTWQDCGWIFPRSHRMFAFPGLVQCGQGNRLSPGGYVYGLSDNDPKRGQDRRLYLFRVRPDAMADLAAYQFFSGTVSTPRWSSDIDARTPVFANAEGISWGITCVYHSASRRYLLCATNHEDMGDWGLYEAPNPWGPWHTVAYGPDFPEWTYTPAEKKRPAYVHTFPAKWISRDGRTLWCVFDRGDRLNVARCTLTLRA